MPTFHAAMLSLAIGAATASVVRADSGRVVAGVDVGSKPYITVLDAQTGDVVTDILAYDESFLGGVFVAAGDVTGDGIADIIAGPGPGPGPGPVVNVYDGFDFSLFDTFYAYDPLFAGGVAVAAADVTGDGYADIITGAGPGAGPHVKVFDGFSGDQIDSFFAYEPSFSGGIHVAGGYIDDDVYADIVTAPRAGGGPNVKIFSGWDLSTIDNFFAYEPAFPGGVFVATGDIDGDGYDDVITGPGAGSGPTVRAFSGADGSLTESFFAYESTFTGGVRVAAADVNGDGLAEIVTGAGSGGGPIVSVFTAGVDEPSDFYAFDPLFTGGVFVAAIAGTSAPDDGDDGDDDGGFRFFFPFFCGAGVLQAVPFTLLGMLGLRLRRSW